MPEPLHLPVKKIEGRVNVDLDCFESLLWGALEIKKQGVWKLRDKGSRIWVGIF